MLEGSKGVNCQASNFLRSFASIQQANALGLLEPEHIPLDNVVSYGPLIQTFFRFLLEQIHQECSSIDTTEDGDKLLQRLFAIPLVSTGICNDRKHQQTRNNSPFVIDLAYPRKVSRG
jgi:PAB-dependent poly(A)-specific ribonuclease subunit 2